MLGTPFYHSTTRKVVAVFGSLFNDIHILREDDLGSEKNDIRVPLAYSPKNTWYAKLRQNMGTEISITLPRMAFEMESISIDMERKGPTLQEHRITGSDPNTRKVMKKEVPYNLGFSLNIAAKNIEDILQIVEQILPWFQPDLNVPIKLNKEFDITRDIPFILESVQPEDPYDGGFTENRMITWTLNFTAKSWVLFPVEDKSIIKNVISKLSSTAEDISTWESEFSTLPYEWTLSVAVHGLTDTLTITDGEETLTFNADGTQSFNMKVRNNNTYNVTIAGQPTGETATIIDGTGTMTGNKTLNINVVSDTIPVNEFSAEFTAEFT